MASYERILAEHRFFKGLEPVYLRLIGACASEVLFDAGAFIFNEGNEANHFYLIRHGWVALEMTTPEKGSLTIQTLREDEVLGSSWLFPPYRWPYDARAVRLTRAIAFDALCLRAACEEDHDLGFELMKRFAEIMTQRLQAARLQLMDMYSLPARRLP